MTRSLGRICMNTRLNIQQAMNTILSLVKDRINVWKISPILEIYYYKIYTLHLLNQLYNFDMILIISNAIKTSNSCYIYT